MKKTVKINGCETGTYSRTAKKCRECPNKEYCSNKRMEQVAYIKPKIYGAIANEVSERLQKAAECYYRK